MSWKMARYGKIWQDMARYGRIWQDGKEQIHTNTFVSLMEKYWLGTMKLHLCMYAFMAPWP